MLMRAERSPAALRRPREKSLFIQGWAGGWEGWRMGWGMWQAQVPVNDAGGGGGGNTQTASKLLGLGAGAAHPNSTPPSRPHLHGQQQDGRRHCDGHRGGRVVQITPQQEDDGDDVQRHNQELPQADRVLHLWERWYGSSNSFLAGRETDIAAQGEGSARELNKRLAAKVPANAPQPGSDAPGPAHLKLPSVGSHHGHQLRGSVTQGAGRCALLGPKVGLLRVNWLDVPSPLLCTAGADPCPPWPTLPIPTHLSRGGVVVQVELRGTQHLHAAKMGQAHMHRSSLAGACGPSQPPPPRRRRHASINATAVHRHSNAHSPPQPTLTWLLVSQTTCSRIFTPALQKANVV